MKAQGIDMDAEMSEALLKAALDGIEAERQAWRALVLALAGAKMEAE